MAWLLWASLGLPGLVNDLGAQSVLSGQSHGSRLTGGAEVGFDSFQEKYSIVDTDTLDSVNEFRSRFRLGYANGTQLRNFFHLEGRALIGDGNYETAARLRLSRVLRGDSRSRLSIGGDFMRRSFDESSSFTFANDLDRFTTRSFLRIGFGPSSLRLSHQLESLNFAERNVFDYDYTRNHVTFSGETNLGLASYLNAGLRYTVMSVPDSSEIEYDAIAPIFEFRSSPELRRQLYLNGAIERRRYGTNATRSSFWAVLANLGIEWPIWNRYSIELLSDLESYHYDVATDAYFNYIENQNVIMWNFRPSWYTKIGLGPMFSFLRSGSSSQDVYEELGARFTVEHTRARLWINAAYEPGQRRYDAFDENSTFGEESVFSDYSFHRFYLFANYRIFDSITFNVFADYRPEDHKRKGDDVTATLFSVSLSYIF